MLKTAIICFILIGTVTLTDVGYYEILGVTKQASTQQIRQAYKKLAIKLHPDKNTDETELEKFLKITEAYETLKDPGKRRKYDIYGSNPSYTRRYDYHSQTEYNNLYYNGLYHDDTNVHTLTGAEFPTFMSEGFYFINFYSPFCPPCQNLVDHWKKLAKVYKGIVKVGAVNCKYHNSFCYNSMRIGSYPTLIFYPNGKNGRQIYYRGEHNFDSLEDFIMPYISSEMHLPTVTKILNDPKPIVYVLGTNRIERNALVRIAYRLKGLVTVVTVEDDNLRQKLSKDDYTTLVYKYRDAVIEIQSADEEDIVKEIVDSMPSAGTIDPDKLRDIRNELRNDETNTWILHFSCEDQNKLLLHQMKMQFPDLNFGYVDCSRWTQLCASLQVDEEGCKGAGVWGALKRGGGYQRAAPAQRDVRHFIHSALDSRTLHTLSVSDFNRILDSDSSMWVLYVVPNGASFDQLFHALLEASKRFTDEDDISFGVIWCDARTQRTACARVAHGGQPVLLVQRANRQHTYSGRADDASLLQFVHLLADTTKLELSEEEVLEIVAVPGREQTWLVAFLPPNCGQHCARLAHQWRIAANKLKPLSMVRVGVLQCEQLSGFCGNVRSPTARLYPIGSSHHYTVGLQQLSEAPYMLEWALDLIVDSIHKLNWNSFSKNVIAEELNPTSGRKPWLVYFHSPRCYRCYEMFADFAIAGILLKGSVELGKVNCVSERGLCQHEQITSYPTLKLYLHRNKHTQFSSAIAIQLREYDQMLQDIQGYMAKYDQSLLDRINSVHGANIKHDEF